MRAHASYVRRGLVLLAVALVAGVTTSAAVAGHGHHGNNGHHGNKGGHGRKAALYVSANGTSGAADRNCHSAGYTTVQSAVDAAPSGGTVVVCRGSYSEDVIISGPLKLLGTHGAVIHGRRQRTETATSSGRAAPGRHLALRPSRSSRAMSPSRA